jgi:hypothetical protein
MNSLPNQTIPNDISTRTKFAQPAGMAPMAQQQKLHANRIEIPPSDNSCYEGMMNCLGSTIGCLG